MRKPLALFIGLRFVRARKKNQLVSFVSLISMLGIALGVLALIAVLSVINASTGTMREETLKAVPHAAVTLPDDLLDWREAAGSLAAAPGVVAVAPFLESEAWLQFDGRGEFVNVRGVTPETEKQILQSPDSQLQAMLDFLAETPDGIILGTRLAGQLGLYPGMQMSVTPLNSLLQRRTEDARSFQMVGVADFGFYDNDAMALVNLPVASQLLTGRDDAVPQLRLRVDDVLNAGVIAREAVAGRWPVASWNETRRSLFDALRMEKILTGFMLLMIVVIGAVNIVATLVMAVADKNADIAILRTMGASRATVMSVFVIQGFAAGVLGTLLGAAGGVLLAMNLGQITRAFQGALNAMLAPGDVYMIAHLDALILWSDVVLVCLCALGVSLLATLYPAWRASRVQPADVLRYE